jgi:hypothetical protein
MNQGREVVHETPIGLLELLVERDLPFGLEVEGHGRGLLVWRVPPAILGGDTAQCRHADLAEQ